MNDTQWKLLRWAFQTLPEKTLQQAFLDARDLSMFLEALFKQQQRAKEFSRKTEDTSLAPELAIQKILMIKEQHQRSLKKPTRTKSVKTKIQERVAEIHALRNGVISDGIEIQPCTWDEIALYLRQSGIRTTPAYIRTTYYAMLGRGASA